MCPRNRFFFQCCQKSKKVWNWYCTSFLYLFANPKFTTNALFHVFSRSHFLWIHISTLVIESFYRSCSGEDPTSTHYLESLECVRWSWKPNKQQAREMLNLLSLNWTFWCVYFWKNNFPSCETPSTSLELWVVWKWECCSTIWSWW